MSAIYGAIEAGGTKFICGLGSSPDDLQLCRVPTTTPEETLSQVLGFFTQHKITMKALGVASFGPVDLNKKSASYGSITSTPKPGWANTDLVGVLSSRLEIPVGVDTDVNGAALGESVWGSGQGLTDFIYLTVGTGIGGGVMVNGELLHGLVHPELGHIFLPQRPDDKYSGKCPFHANQCFEGLASGPAMAERWGVAAENLPENHEAWKMQAWYLARAICSLVCSYSPQRIILGGGVMEQEGLLPMVRREVLSALNGYVQHEAILNNIESYIVPPGLGNRAGVVGALELAKRA